MPAKFIKYILFLLVFCILSLFPLFYIFIVKNITVLEKDACVNSEDLIKETGILGKSIFLINKDIISHRLLKKFTCIEKVEVLAKLPSSVEITYYGQKPVVRVDSSDLLLTSGALAIKAQSSTDNLPVFFLPEEIEVREGAKISDPNSILALEIINLLLKSDFVPTNVRIVNDSITVYNQQDTVVIFSTKKKAEIQSDSLQKVLAKVKMEPKKISKIDMRFDDPIIVFEQKN